MQWICKLWWFFFEIPHKKNRNHPICERQFPVVLPHELVPWLHRNGAWPHDISESDLRDYWGNCKKQQLPWSDAATDLEGSMHPFFIWGDDCQYNESYEKLIVICMGHTLDRRTFSLESCWPIIVIREVSSHIFAQKLFFFLKLYGFCILLIKKKLFLLIRWSNIAIDNGLIMYS